MAARDVATTAQCKIAGDMGRSGASPVSDFSAPSAALRSQGSRLNAGYAEVISPRSLDENAARLVAEAVKVLSPQCVVTAVALRQPHPGTSDSDLARVIRNANRLPSEEQTEDGHARSIVVIAWARS